MGLEETNILFVEDDMAACKSLPPILKSYGFKVNTANTFRQAIQEIEANTYGLYLIDINIPGGDGFDLCRIIREKENTPVIFVTGVNDEASIVFGLGLGADDYITKPYTLQVLLARIKSVLRPMCGPSGRQRAFRHADAIPYSEAADQKSWSHADA